MAALDIYTPTQNASTGIPGMDDDKPMSDVPSFAALEKEELANKSLQRAAAIQQLQLQKTRDEQGMTFASQEEAEKAGYNTEGAAVLPNGRIRIPKVVGRDVSKNVGQQEVDKKKGRAQLMEAQKQLDSGKNLTGPIIGILPDSVLRFTNPEAVQTRETIEEVVQRNLKAVLGGAFTKGEGDRLIARAYNPGLSEEQNSVRLKRLLKQIELATDAKAAAAAHYRKYGTLRGWEGKMPRLSDFDPENDTTPGTGTTPAQPPAQPPAKKTGKEIIERNGKRYEVDHDTKAVREI